MIEYSPLDWIKIAVANAYGKDKNSFEERIKWFEENSSKLDTLINKAKDPAYMYAGIMAYEDTLRRKPIGFLVSVDASASGMQVLSTLSGCSKTAALIGLIGGTRKNVYASIKKALEIEGVEYELIKEAIMTYFYGSVRVPWRVFGYKYPLFIKRMAIIAPGAYCCTQLFLNSRDDSSEYSWSLPDGFRVKAKIFTKKKVGIYIPEMKHTFNHVYDVQESNKRDVSIAANITHSVDAYVCREMIRRAYDNGFEIITIHYDFRCHPLYVNKMRRNYNEIMAEIAESNLLSEIMSSVRRGVINYAPIDEKLGSKIREGNYALN